MYVCRTDLGGTPSEVALTHCFITDSKKKKKSMCPVFDICLIDVVLHCFFH